MGEIRSYLPKKDHETTPLEFAGPDAQQAWNSMSESDHDHLVSNIDGRRRDRLKEIFSNNCVLYFPANRFEEPAWLNQSNLISKADYMDISHLEGHTDRRIVNYSPLREIQNWLFDLAYDRTVFETRIQRVENLLISQGNDTYSSMPPLSVFFGYHGQATNIYDAAFAVFKSILRLSSAARLGIGQRIRRTMSIMENESPLVSNIFHLSSGETALITLFLSILRDFDLCDRQFQNTQDIRGVVVVDEIDLHLHAVQQYEILPALIATFPNVQFVLTSHSPLFVLGLRKTLGENGFDLHLLPQGIQVSPEEFGEFEKAYQVFRDTEAFLTDIRLAVENASMPLVFVDGETDVKYLKRASEVLGLQHVLNDLELRAGGGEAKLKSAWKSLRTSSTLGLIHHKVVIIHDCDSRSDCSDIENVFRRKIPFIDEHPIKTGIENLFSFATIEKAKAFKPAFIDIDPCRTKISRGEEVNIPASWTVNEDEKTNLCDWICENATEKDFRDFEAVFDLLNEIPDLYRSQSQ